jgi:hypothetical protein
LVKNSSKGIRGSIPFPSPPLKEIFSFEQLLFEIGFFADGMPNAFCYVDDVSLVKK